MPQSSFCLDFVEDVVPHLDAAYNLARWLTRNDQDAQDVVQEAFMRAFRFLGGFRGGNVRAWLLRIVRNTCYTWLHQNRPQHPTLEFDESKKLAARDITESKPLIETLEVRRKGQPVVLTALEFKALKYFLQNARRAISRDELLNQVWGYENYPCTRTVDNHILKLRQKLEPDPSRPVHFLTVHGTGYKFLP